MQYAGRVGTLPGYNKSRNTYTSTADWDRFDVVVRTPNCIQSVQGFLCKDSPYREMIEEFNDFKKTVRETGEWNGRKINEGETLVFGDYPRKM